MPRFSQKREAILDCLRETKSHPSAEWIFHRLRPRFPDLSLGTVYRNLGQFKRQGLASSVGVVGGLERFDGEVTPHPHFVCDRCGEVLDLPAQPLPESIRAEVETLGVQVTGYTCCLHGVCQICQSMEHGNIENQKENSNNSGGM